MCDVPGKTTVTDERASQANFTDESQDPRIPGGRSPAERRHMSPTRRESGRPPMSPLRCTLQQGTGRPTGGRSRGRGPVGRCCLYYQAYVGLRRPTERRPLIDLQHLPKGGRTTRHAACAGSTFTVTGACRDADGKARARQQRHRQWLQFRSVQSSTNFSLVRVNRRLLLPERPLAFGRRQCVALPDNGQAKGRDVDGTASKTRQWSDSRHASQSVQSPRRLFRARTRPPTSGERSDNGTWTGRRAW